MQKRENRVFPFVAESVEGARIPLVSFLKMPISCCALPWRTKL